MKSSFTGAKVESILKVANGKKYSDNATDATTGQVLTKTSDGVEWQDNAGGATFTLSDDGTKLYITTA